MRNKIIRVAVRIILISGFIFLLQISACIHPAKEAERYASLDDSTAYVGKETCRQCHSDKFDTYMHTGMGLSFDRASQQKTSAVFTGHDIIRDSLMNLNYHPFWKNDSLMLLEFRMKGKDTVFRREEKISWIVGSGQHTNSHMMNVNGYIYQAPVTFYTQKKKWDLPPGFEGGYNSRFSRMIGLECMTCHNAYPKMVEGSENKYTFVANGIDCERCHGPGSKHANEKLAGHTVDINSQIDYTIVNPSKLPINLQLDVCQRCHIQGNAVLNEGKSFLDFRPGMRLSEVMNVFMPVFKGDDQSHIMASHAERMKMSRCFIESIRQADKINEPHPTLKPYVNAMTCVTCHDPHISVKATDQSVFNQKCASCHARSGLQVSEINRIHSSINCTESLIERNKVGNSCVYCHMPKNNTIDIPHVTTTDHWIRKPVLKNDENRIKEFTGLACINNPGVSGVVKGTAFLSYFEKFSPNPSYLDSAKKYLDDSTPDSILSNFKELVRWAYLKSDFKKVVSYSGDVKQVLSLLNKKSYSNDDAWAAYRIGESYSNLNDLRNAMIFYQRAVNLAPFQLDFRNKLAGAEQDNGDLPEAAKNYNFIIHENPEYASAYVSLGYLILTKDRDVEKAEAMYDKALALDPDNVQAYLNKAGIMIYLGDHAKAKDYLKEVLKRDKNNVIANKLITQIPTAKYDQSKTRNR